MNANTMCEAARSAMIAGVVRKKPMVVPMQTATATAGEINIPRNTATWLASVNDIGPSTIRGMNIGTTMPIAQRIPASTIWYSLFLVIVMEYRSFRPLLVNR